MHRPDPHQARARELCLATGVDPDSRMGDGRGRPAWCDYRDAARKEPRRFRSAAGMKTKGPRELVI